MGSWAAFVIGMLFFILPMIFNMFVAFLQVGGTMQIISIGGAFALISLQALQPMTHSV